MRVNPVSADKANEGAGSFEPLKPGDYDFSVYEAEDTVSAAGNEMLKLTIHILLGDGKHRTVFDYILASESGAWKARHFAESVRMLNEYEQGNLDPDFMIGRAGRLKLKIKPASGQYAAGNQVADYLPPSDGRAAAPQRTPAINRAPAPSREKVPAGDIDDEIPF